ncbi:hypothetical protein BIFBRE_04337 [Bifidobacterium breve DSM 20213 = JCM 1192]|uniref:Uncharacterized protein n=1 Tax=Bifidobacterium breve DSM 20213 = JCM 1192 TaxID=518634 RepID=D4BQG7_BIFBR|nr:hypothetical protein BIFBRE_04337 [Bifidobacterium breve DSM 20213 = JCM 1192]
MEHQGFWRYRPSTPEVDAIHVFVNLQQTRIGKFVGYHEIARNRTLLRWQP